jgi:hypothetical protein
LKGKDLILCKKLDAVMKYEPYDDIYLAPRDFCGFIPLMNSGKNNKENNCQSITVIVDGAIRILIYTGRKIQINEELMYSYGKDFRY